MSEHAPQYSISECIRDSYSDHDPVVIDCKTFVNNHKSNWKLFIFYSFAIQQ